MSEIPETPGSAGNRTGERCSGGFSIRSSPRGFLVGLVSVFCVLSMSVQVARTSSLEPEAASRIYATLTEWGVEASGVGAPADASEIRAHIRALESPHSEKRVRAARWLADHGIQRAGGQIAASMRDPGTLRPCQLAHSLGRLGDERWVDVLVSSAKQRGNTDLRTCSAIALAHLASSRAVDDLIGITRDDPSRIFATKALAAAADPESRDHLRWLASSSSSAAVRRIARRGIERIALLQAEDPIAALLERARAAASADDVDEWTLRQLARRPNARSAEVLSDLFRDRQRSSREREVIAATLIAIGEPGHRALGELALGGRQGGAGVARAALGLIRERSPMG